MSMDFKEMLDKLNSIENIKKIRWLLLLLFYQENFIGGSSYNFFGFFFFSTFDLASSFKYKSRYSSFY